MIKALSHYTIASLDIEANVIFYSKVLGLKHGDHLDGAEPGAYFYTDDNPIPLVHIVDQSLQVEKQDTDFQLDAKAVTSAPKQLATGGLDHIAFSVSMDVFDEFESRLQQYKFDYRVGQDLMPKMKQIWVLDPNGIKVELNFS